MKNLNYDKFEHFKFLNKIHGPSDLKKLKIDELIILSKEIRQKILDVVSKNGGHLASNLGVVELTVALHKAFNSPNDKIIFDVGHQCYAHKILTGRFNEFNTLRQEGGVSGFSKPYESEHDVAISGHASTSISLACGFAIPEIFRKTKNKVVAVIGDGALTGGMAYEGLNNGVNLNNLIIILNCNDMSISKTVGSIPRYISKIRTQQIYISTSFFIEKILKKIPFIGLLLANLILNFKKILKKIIYRSNFFADLGYFFLSPVKGHDMFELLKALNWAKNQKGPAIIQVFTQKGFGYEKAEKNPQLYHSVGNFNLKKGVSEEVNSNCFSDVFGRYICKLAECDEQICVVTAAMEFGTGLHYFKNKFPKRFFDVGIAESHAVTFAAGLSLNGMVPIFAVYSTFLQRSYDQILHDLAISNLHVILVVDRAGLVDGDGETHQGIFDSSFLSAIPNVTVFAPVNYLELQQNLNAAIYENKGVVAIRYSKGRQSDFLKNSKTFDKVFANNFSILGNSKVVLISYGNLTEQLILARNKLLKCYNFEVALVKINKINPIDDKLLNNLNLFDEIFFFEEGIEKGGIGHNLILKMVGNKFAGKLFLSAISDVFVKNLNSKVAMKQFALDFESIVDKVITNSEVFRRSKEL